MQSRADAEKDKKIFILVNEIFLYCDSCLLVLSFILMFVFVRHRCVALMFLFYCCFYGAQAAQHYFIKIFPKIDVNKHYVLYRRLIMLIMTVDGVYLFASIIFWQKASAHPIYCALHQYFGIGLWVGIVLVMHFIFSLFWGITLIQSYINRRYYLLAMGGFEIEQRILNEQRAIRESMMIREPNIDDYPIPREGKYYKFEDALDADLATDECSICYNKEEESHFVDAGCGHFFH